MLDTRLKIGIVINAAFTIIEFSIGILTGSLALISDASHNLTDVMSLIISYFARKIAQKKPDSRKTYGYGRATVLSALLNASILCAIAIYIFSAAYQRYYNPEKIEGGIVMLVGFFGILVNGGIALLFVNHRHDINIKSAFLNMIFDAIASAGALLAGIIILTTNYTFVDPLISMVIASMLLFASWNILKQAIHVLFEGVPDNISVSKVESEIKNIIPVTKVEDLHIWAISCNKTALSCNVTLECDDMGRCVNAVKQIKKQLKKEFNITHSTIEISTQASKEKICAL